MSEVVLNSCEQYLSLLANQMAHLPSQVLWYLGATWEPRDLPLGLKRGAPKRCYENAAKLAFCDSEFTYCEGYARPGGLIPVAHAWCVDSSGKVVDPTWADAETAQYFGIALSEDFVRDQCLKKEVWGVFGELMTLELFFEVIEANRCTPWPAESQKVEQLRELLNQVQAQRTQKKAAPKLSRSAG